MIGLPPQSLTASTPGTAITPESGATHDLTAVRATVLIDALTAAGGKNLCRQGISRRGQQHPHAVQRPSATTAAVAPSALRMKSAHWRRQRRRARDGVAAGGQRSASGAPPLSTGAGVVLTTSTANVIDMPMTGVCAAGEAALRSMARSSPASCFRAESASTRSAPIPPTREFCYTTGAEFVVDEAQPSSEFVLPSATGVHRSLVESTRCERPPLRRRWRSCRIRGDAAVRTPVRRARNRARSPHAGVRAGPSPPVPGRAGPRR